MNIDSRICEYVITDFIQTHTPILTVHDSFIVHYGHGELGELEEDMRRAFHGHFKKDIKVKEEIGVMLPSSFDGKDWDELSFEEQVCDPPEYSRWENKNSLAYSTF